VVERYVALWQEEVPFCKREKWIAGGKAGDEMVFPCLDGSFCCVASVAMRGNALKFDFVFPEGVFQACGAFVVEDV